MEAGGRVRIGPRPIKKSLIHLVTHLVTTETSGVRLRGFCLDSMQHNRHPTRFSAPSKCLCRRWESTPLSMRFCTCYWQLGHVRIRHRAKREKRPCVLQLPFSGSPLPPRMCTFLSVRSRDYLLPQQRSYLSTALKRSPTRKEGQKEANKTSAEQRLADSSRLENSPPKSKSERGSITTGFFGNPNQGRPKRIKGQGEGVRENSLNGSKRLSRCPALNKTNPPPSVSQRCIYSERSGGRQNTDNFTQNVCSRLGRRDTTPPAMRCHLRLARTCRTAL
jgi:hypothetical protein